MANDVDGISTLLKKRLECATGVKKEFFRPSQQAERVLEDLRTHCCSSNKAVQLEALKCWGMWIHNQKPDDWKLNTVCFASVRPLIPKKLQPLHKDTDICTVKLSLMWALLVKVQNLIHLEGPQYILEVLLQTCLTWLSSDNEDECENYTCSLIFQLLLRLFKKDEILSDFDKDTFPPLTVHVLHSKKLFHRLAEKFLKVFVYWRKVQDKTLILKLWKHFLEHCELSCEHIPIPLWHKIFKQVTQICSEKREPIKERLAFLHVCATTLKSALSSSKIIDFGNLLTTPCEALVKKLVEICCAVVPDEHCDSQMFYNSKEISEVLSVKSVALGGYVLCISVLDILEEFWLRDLFWGVWCGLVYCYKILLRDIDKSQLTEVQTKFYRKLRGIAVNFELDRNNLHKDCIKEVEEHISVLNISCVCPVHTIKTTKDPTRKEASVELMNADSFQPSESPPTNRPCPEEISEQIVRFERTRFYGKFSDTIAHNRALPGRAINLSGDLIKNILTAIGTNLLKSSPNCSFVCRFIKFQTLGPHGAIQIPRSRSLGYKPAVQNKERRSTPSVKSETLSRVPDGVPAKRNEIFLHATEEEEKVEETISTPLTRSRRRAEEEGKRELERQTRRKRKSFEDLVQEILKRNKARKTEKTSRKKSSISQTRNKKKLRAREKKSESSAVELPFRQLRNTKKGEPKERKSKKTDGKLENYFEVLSKKSGKEMKKEESKNLRMKKGKKKTKESTCCKPEKDEGERKGEIGWRQTSLKTMMNQKNRIHGGVRPRNKVPRAKNKVDACPLAHMSPFKEVLHDHEYVKIDPERFQEGVFLTSRKRKVGKPKTGEEKLSKPELNECEVSGTTFSEGKSEYDRIEGVHTEPLEQSKSVIAGPKKLNPQEKSETFCTEQMQESDIRVELTEEKTSIEVKIVQETPIKGSIKRMRANEDHVGNKRIKLEMEDLREEKLSPEITEKENLEERQAPREKMGCSTLNTMSRALRMIALVPESTKGGQIQRESLSRVEALKCKKGPNVDRSSRASKMLALLSENVVDVEGVCEMKMQDINSWEDMTTIPNAKTPVSSMKSPKSVKKRKSIRFDDAKNETVLYQTDTPPSQILEEKEKSRRIKHGAITVDLS